MADDKFIEEEELLFEEEVTQEEVQEYPLLEEGDDSEYDFLGEISQKVEEKEKPKPKQQFKAKAHKPMNTFIGSEEAFDTLMSFIHPSLKKGSDKLEVREDDLAAVLAIMSNATKAFDTLLLVVNLVTNIDPLDPKASKEAISKLLKNQSEKSDSLIDWAKSNGLSLEVFPDAKAMSSALDMVYRTVQRFCDRASLLKEEYDSSKEVAALQTKVDGLQRVIASLETDLARSVDKVVAVENRVVRYGLRTGFVPSPGKPKVYRYLSDIRVKTLADGAKEYRPVFSEKDHAKGYSLSDVQKALKLCQDLPKTKVSPLVKTQVNNLQIVTL